MVGGVGYFYPCAIIWTYRCSAGVRVYVIASSIDRSPDNFAYLGHGDHK